MRVVNDLILRGKGPEIDKLVGRMESDTRNGFWKREPEVEANLRQTSVGRLGVYCYSWRGNEGKPPASLLIYRTGQEELALSNIVPAARRPLTDEEFNNILAEFNQDVLHPLTEDIEIETTITTPRDNRLEESLSPNAFRELIRFISGAVEHEELTIDDRVQWDQFWSQAYSDGSVFDHKDLVDWLLDQGLSEPQASALISRMHAGRMIADHGGI